MDSEFEISTMSHITKVFDFQSLYHLKTLHSLQD